jgi:hypothetical protein
MAFRTTVRPDRVLVGVTSGHKRHHVKPRVYNPQCLLCRAAGRERVEAGVGLDIPVMTGREYREEAPTQAE